MEILHLCLSPGHSFFGHHGQEPADFPMVEVAQVECMAGHGIRGDRFFDHRDEYKGQITFFAEEVYAALCTALKRHDRPASVLRRNVVTRGVDLAAYIGEEWEVQGVRFQGMEECRPCFWMNQAFGQGAEDFLRGRGGLRARIITNGRLQLGSAAFSRIHSSLPVLPTA